MTKTEARILDTLRAGEIHGGEPVTMTLSGTRELNAARKLCERALIDITVIAGSEYQRRGRGCRVWYKRVPYVHYIVKAGIGRFDGPT